MANEAVAPAKQPTREELLAEIERLQAVAKATPATIDIKISEKGAVSVYGLGRFPVTLYYEQWRRLLAVATQLTAFIDKHVANGTLKPKAAKE